MKNRFKNETPKDQNGINFNISPNDMIDILCEKCEGQFFSPVFVFKKVSAVMSPTGKATLIPAQLFKCDSCGHINEEFLPKTPSGDKIEIRTSK